MVSAGDIAAQASQYVGPLVSLLWGVLQFAFVITILVIIGIFLTYNKKVMIREMTKNNRTIVRMVRAKKVTGKNVSHPQIQLFGFGGKRITQPPSDCIYPYKSLLGSTTLYDFVLKDGIYFPIANVVLGKRYIVSELKPSEDMLAWAEENGYDIKEHKENEKVIFTMEGSGLEVDRNFDAEQSTTHNMALIAEKYRNKKPGEVYMLYGVVILAIVGGFVTVVYSLYKAGQVTDAVNQGWELFRTWTNTVGSSKQGPG